MPPTTFIYALCEPGTRTVRYIGKSNNPVRRLKLHLSDSRKKENPLGDWLRLLGGAVPNLVVLREVPTEKWQESEKRYICLARGLGMSLTNSNDGGGGVSKHSEKTCEKISASLRGWEFSPEHLANLSAALRGKKRSPEICARMSASKLGKKHSAERRAGNSAAQRFPETRAKKSSAQSAAIFSHHQFRRMPCFSDGGGI